MSIEIKQHLRLSQQLVMTPQLQQAIKLLQLSRMELCDMVRDEMLENPILEDSVESANEQAKAAEAAKNPPMPPAGPMPMGMPPPGGPPGMAPPEGPLPGMPPAPMP
ncbi:MAG TPA: hypothetical protein VHU40_13630, partial [Polyangia bacterium]|nr:hypothetical protein [Polyangia bacterium]